MRLEVVEKHAIYAEGNEFVLVDTGSPVTIERQGPSIADMLGGLMSGLGMDQGLRNHVLGQLGTVRGQAIAAELGLSEKNRPLVDLDEVSGKVGRTICKLLGTDGMMAGPVLIDYRNNRIEFDYSDDEEFPHELPCRMLAGIPVVTIRVAGAKHWMFLDTGAPTSYISSAITAGMTPTGSIPDFHPQVGEFSVNTFELETEIADFKGTVTYGNLPPRLAQYEQVGCDGIIGYDLFSRFATLLDMVAGKIHVRS